VCLARTASSLGVVNSSDVIALVSVVVSPASALIAVWLTQRATAEQKAAERAATGRAEALNGLARFASVAIDADPRLVANGDLREYASPDAAISGLYARWVAAREALVLLRFSHPSQEVQDLAQDAQAELEIALRKTEDAIKNHGDLSAARKAWQGCLDKLGRLGPLLSGQP
jgi:hypothetical protein